MCMRLSHVVHASRPFLWAQPERCARRRRRRRRCLMWSAWIWKLYRCVVCVCVGVSSCHRVFERVFFECNITLTFGLLFLFRLDFCICRPPSNKTEAHTPTLHVAREMCRQHVCILIGTMVCAVTVFCSVCLCRRRSVTFLVQISIGNISYVCVFGQLWHYV